MRPDPPDPAWGLRLFCAIAVPVDDSIARAHLAAAARLSRLSGGTIHLLCVAGTRLPPAVAGFVKRERLVREGIRWAERNLASARAALADAGAPEPERHVREGAPGARIAQFIETERIDCVVAGTHGRRGLGRWLLGSLAGQIVRTAPVPVLTVPMSGRKDDGWRDWPRRILVAMDDSIASRRAARVAARIAAACGARLDVLAVGETFPLPSGISAASGSLARGRIWGSRVASAASRACAALGVAEVRVHVRLGDPVREILAVARATGAELIAMGTHGRRGVRRFFLGSAAEGVLARAVVPVLTACALGARGGRP